MTNEKITEMSKQACSYSRVSAGYFDSKRGEPVFTGDVYYEEGAMYPYHIVKKAEKGFNIEHVGSGDVFDFSKNAKTLINNEYIGNIYVDKILESKIYDKQNVEVETPTYEVKEEKENAVEKVNKEETEETNDNTVENNTDNADSGDNSDNLAGDLDNEVPQQVEQEDNQTVQTTPQNKEAEYLKDRIKTYEKHIDGLKKKNEELEKEAVQFDNLVSTLDSSSFIELKNLIFTAVVDNANRFNAKECEKIIKKGKVINDLEDILKEYKDFGETNRKNINLNNKEIDNYEVKIEEAKSKLDKVQAQLTIFDNQEEQNVGQVCPTDEANEAETNSDEENLKQEDCQGMSYPQAQKEQETSESDSVPNNEQPKEESVYPKSEELEKHATEIGEEIPF